jgi:hypothetical protein
LPPDVDAGGKPSVGTVTSNSAHRLATRRKGRRSSGIGVPVGGFVVLEL